MLGAAVAGAAHALDPAALGHPLHEGDALLVLGAEGPAAAVHLDQDGRADDVAVGTGNLQEDFAMVTGEWTDETGVSDLPASVVGCYVRLLLRTLRHIYSVAGSTLLGQWEGAALPRDGGIMGASGPFTGQVAA